jgi:hypothetical protein
MVELFCHLDTIISYIYCKYIVSVYSLCFKFAYEFYCPDVLLKFTLVFCFFFLTLLRFEFWALCLLGCTVALSPAPKPSSVGFAKNCCSELL